ncbi:MAG: tryptophan synthase subunit alpha [Promethearchaeota archaeon]
MQKMDDKLKFTGISPVKNRLDDFINNLVPKKEGAFVPFFVIGDPTPNMFIKIIKKIEPFADIIELGIPFSDPIADGPVIQEANKRAFNTGINPNKAFDLIKQIRSFINKPIVILTYANILGVNEKLEYTLENLSKAGVDGIIAADIPIEESKAVISLCHKYNMHFILLVAPTTTPERLKQIASKSTGFIYLVAVKGVTGARESIKDETKQTIINTKKTLKKFNKENIPVFVGFGISKPKHIKEIMKLGADGVIVGSAIIKIIQENFRKSTNNKKDLKDIEKLPDLIRDFIINLKNATKSN